MRTLGNSGIFRVLGGLLAAAITGGCEPAEERAPVDEASGPAVPTAATFDVAAVMRQVRLGYRPEADGYAAEPGTYEVRAAADGTVRFTPYRFPDATELGDDAPVGGRPLVVRTRSIGRTGGDAVGHPAPATPPALRVEKDGSLAIDRGAVVERWLNDDDGASQSWWFARRPEGQGDLVVTLQASAPLYLGRSDGGHHFADPEARVGVRYGSATWVDARGRRTPVEAAWRDGGLALSVPAALVDATTYPAALDPVLSPELAPDRPVISHLPVQDGLGLACTPDLCLATWVQYRNARRQTIGTRISAGGDVLDPGGLIVSTGWDGRRRDRRTAVATDGADFLVVVQRIDPDEYSLRVARVTAAGELPDAPDGRLLAESRSVGFGNAPTMTRPVATYGAGRYLVAWSVQREAGSDLNLQARLLDRDALPVGDVVSVNAYGGDQVADAAVFNGDHFVLAGSTGVSGSEEMGVYRVTLDGLPLTLDALVEVDPAEDAEAALATDGRDALLVWRRGVDTLRGVVVGREGLGAPFDVLPAGSGAAAPALTGDGQNYLLAWSVEDVPALRARLLDRAGGPLSGIFDVAAGAVHEEPHAATLDGQFVVLSNWTPDGVVAARIGPSGQVRDPAGVPVSTRVANAQSEPAVVSDGTGYLLVWADDRGGLLPQIYGARVSAAGALRDPAGLAIADSPTPKGAPTVAWSGTHALVVWEALHEGTGVDLEAARVAPDGRVFGALDVVGVAGDQLRPRAIWDGEHFFVVWEDWRGPDADVVGARIEPVGAVLDPGGFGIATGRDDQTSPALASDGVKIHVVFEDWAAGGTFAPDLAEVRVLPSGLVVDGAPRSLVAADGRQASPAVVPDGAGNVVVFFADDRAGEGLDVRATRVTREGVVIHVDGFLVAGGPGDQDEPAVALGGGTRILATWNGRADAPAPDVYGLMLNSRTLRAVGAPLAVATTPDAESASTVAFGPGGAALVAYEADVRAWDRRRVRATWVHEAAVP